MGIGENVGENAGENTGTTGTGFGGPLSQRLLYQSDISYVGSFDLPTPGSGSFDYGGSGLAISGSTLYVGGHRTTSMSIGAVTIPDPIAGTASLVYNPTVISGSIGGSCGGSVEISGCLVYNNRLIVSKRCFYDNEGWLGDSHQHCTLALGSPSSMSLMDHSNYKQFINGYMGYIPDEWQSLLGGPAFVGNSAMSINSQCSNGPSFYVFDPDDVGVEDPIPTTELMKFPYPDDMLSNPDVANDLYSRADQDNAGLVFPSGTRSVLFWTRHGYGTPTYKVEDGCGGIGGEGAAPYRYQITAFDANQLYEVKNGLRTSVNCSPYTWFTVPGISDTCCKFAYSGLVYDPSSRRVYACLDYAENPSVHVWQIN